MKQTLYILTVLILLTACHRNYFTINNNSVRTKITTDTWSVQKHIGQELVSDSLLYPYESLFSNLNLTLNEISQKQFQSYSNKSNLGCEIDSGQFIQRSEIYVRHDCNKICETYLCEKATNRKMIMPSNYDAGILSMSFSPSCSQLMISSSYDGPDFREYYEHRAEIFIFNVTTGNGLSGIKPSLKFYTKDWSIDDLIWINDKTIALKVYEEGKQSAESKNNYKYYKTKLSK